MNLQVIFDKVDASSFFQIKKIRKLDVIDFHIFNLKLFIEHFDVQNA